MSRKPDPADEIVSTGSWDASLVRRLVREARPHRRLFAGTFLILALLFGLELVGPWLLRHAIDGPVSAALRAREADPRGFDAAPYLRALAGWAGAYLLCSLATIGLRYLEVAHLNRTGQAVIAGLRVRLFRHLQALDVGYFDRRPTGSLVTRVTTDIENLNEMFTSGLVELVVDVLQILALVAILFAIHPGLALVVLALLPVLVGISLVFRGGARAAHRVVRARLSRLNGYLQEVLSGVRVVQVFRREDRVSERFATHLEGYLQANIRTILLFALFYPLIDFAASGIQGATVWKGGLEIAARSLSFGVFFQFWFYVNMLLNPVRELGERYNVLQSAFASAERVFDVLDTVPRISSPPGPEARLLEGPSEAGVHVRFEGVCFRYLEGVPVLRDVSFEILPGQTVAAVGATGAGKSTLVNLLLRYYDPTEGRILVNGVDLRDYDLTSLRSRIGLVLQEDFLFSGTVRENLVMEREDVTEESLELALTASRADGVIARLPGQIHAPVAERGATFSTGERQLLAIARALAGRPRLVVLDEATASVDSNIEAQIESAQRRLLEGRSALVIAHRLSTVRRADRILVLHRGQLRETGTHQELLRLDGIYARLHTLQFADAG